MEQKLEERMKLNFIDLLFSFSFALDCVENQLCGVTDGHSKRTACLCVLTGKQLGLPELALADLAGLALLHDNALTEYITEELESGSDVVKQKELIRAGKHCVIGERNIEGIPFATNVEGAILYHHENADGSGPFQKKADETPLYAQLIHLADQVDVRWNLKNGTRGKYEHVRQYVLENQDILFSELCVTAFLAAVTEQQMEQMQEDGINRVLRELVPDCSTEYDREEIYSFCNLFAKITDYKSGFTMRHSRGIAEKAEIMGRFYGYEEEKITKLYFAGAIHDLGKLVINNDVLEKPDKLTDQEYSYMKNHAWYTYEILKRVRGLEEITSWASNHHEKLNGTGYPFGKTKDELSFEERLIACLDIYQALTEPRPYKAGFSQEQTMEIMERMIEKGEIDAGITKDIKAALKE